ncbi:MAG: ribonuclease P protein component [bacterium]|nr:ribonuclease P protein component [bacterium]
MDFQRCYRRGRKRHGSLASLHYHSTEKQDVRLGITASRKVGKAVVRHLLKRRVREIFRRFAGRDLLRPMDIVVHLKPASANAEFTTLVEELEGLLATLPRQESATHRPGP